MARAWKQFNGVGGWVDWPAGTGLLDPSTVWRARFLNQFIGWMRYIGNFVWDEYDYPQPLRDDVPVDWVKPGDVIQHLKFWNAIGQFDVLDEPDYPENVWIAVDDVDDLKELGATFDGTAELADSEAYAELLEQEPLEPGANLQAALVGLLTRARARLDMCQLWRNGRMTAYVPDEEPDTLHSWSKTGGAFGEWSDYAEINGAISNSPHESPVDGRNVYTLPGWGSSAYTYPVDGGVDSRGGLRVENHYMVATARKVEAAWHGVLVTARSVIKENSGVSPAPPWDTTDDLVFGYADDLGEEEKLLDDNPDWTFLPDQNPSADFKRTWSGSGFYCYLDNTLPEQFTPEGNEEA